MTKKQTMEETDTSIWHSNFIKVDPRDIQSIIGMLMRNPSKEDDEVINFIEAYILGKKPKVGKNKIN